MKKKYKLLFSISSLFFAFAALVMGVFALTQNTYTVKGSMSYSLEYGLLEIETSVYKYVGIPISQEQGEKYFGNFSELESIPEYDKYYCTYDENYLLKDTVENQQLTGLDFDYRDGQAYFVVVHVVSQTKNKAIKVTVETSFNVENSWFVTTGSTILTKNKTGKDIIFAWGVENSAFSSNGNFNFNITFEEDTEYVPEDTGVVGVTIDDKSTTEEVYIENFTQQFNTFTEADYYENKMPITIATNQIESIEDDGEILYAPIINLNTGKFGIETVVSYELKNVALYDQYGRTITLEQDSIMYMPVYGKNFAGLQELLAYFQGSGTEPIPQFAPPKLTLRVGVQEEVKACILIGFFSDSTMQPTSIKFDLIVTVQERIVNKGTKIPYATKSVVMMNGDSYIAPGRTKTKEQANYVLDTTKYDLIEVDDRIVEVQMTMADIMLYLESFGMCEVPAVMENLELYGNPLVLLQIYGVYFMMISSEIDGYLPIVKTQSTIQGRLFEQENWFSDLFYLLMIFDPMSTEEKTAFAEQYLMPLPASETDPITIPVHLYKIENCNAYISTLATFIAFLFNESASTGPLEYYTTLMSIMIQIYVQQGVLSPSQYGLPDDYTNADFLRILLSTEVQVPSLDIISEQELLMSSFVDLEYTVFVPGDEVEVKIETNNQSVNTVKKFGSLYFSYDTVEYNINEIKNISFLNCKEFTTTNASYRAVDGVLYTVDNKLIKYPNLKEGNQYTIVNGTTEILSNAFENVTKLTTLTAPLSVNKIGQDVFDNSSIGVFNVYQPMIDNCMENFVQSAKGSVITETNIYATTYISSTQKDELVVISGLPINIIYSDDMFGITYEERQNGAYVIGLSNTSFYGIEIPKTVQIGLEVFNIVGIADGVFANCVNVEEITLPSTITHIGNNNFANCSNLKKVYLGTATLTTFGTGNIHADLEIYTKNETTNALIMSSYANAISVDWELMIERYHKGMGNSGNPSGSSENFRYVLTLGQKQYVKESIYVNDLSNHQLDNIMIVFPQTAGALNVSITATINAKGSGDNLIESIQELISLSRKESNGTYTKLMGTPTDETYANHNQVTTVTVSYPNNGTPVTVNTGDELRLRIYFTVMENAKCFTTGTQVTMADGTYKNIEDITYDDLLMVYDFDRGEFSVSYAAWMATPSTYGCYYLMEFDDGSTLDIVISHRLFTEDDLDYNKSIDADYSSIGKKFVRQIMVDGIPRLTTVTCTNITRIEEEITYYNIVTSQALNFFSNGFIGATGIANMYNFEKIDDQTYVHNQEQLNYTKSGTTDDETGTMFAYERFNTEKIPYYIYVAYRLGEIRNMVNVLSKVPPYNQYPLSFVEAYAIGLVNDYFKDSYMDDIAKMPDTFKVTLSDREQNVRYEEKELYTVPTPLNTTNFIGWYNTFDGKIYQPGETAEIYMNTHFIARYA